MLKSTTGLETDDFQAVLNFLTPVLIARISNFMMAKIKKT